MHYLYILKSKKQDRLHIGLTSNLERRISEHNTGKTRSTKAYAPFSLVYYEAYLSRKDAKLRETKMKQFGQAYRRIKERISESLRNAS